MNTAIQEKIRKLLALAGNNPSKEEAAAALAKAQALMTEHKITNLAAFEMSAEEKEEAEILTHWGKEENITGALWKADLVHFLCRYNGCFTYNSGSSIGIAGKPSNIQTVAYIFQFCATQIDMLAKMNAAGLGRSYVNSYKLGCVHAIQSAIVEERVQLENKLQHEAAASNDCRALARLDNALAIVRKEHAKAESYCRAKVKLRSSRAASRSINGDGYAAGKAAGAGIYGRSKNAGAKRIA